VPEGNVRDRLRTHASDQSGFHRAVTRGPNAAWYPIGQSVFLSGIEPVDEDDENDWLEVYYWEYVEILFASKWGWRQDIDDMGLSERGRWVQIIEALTAAEAKKTPAAPPPV
jgi:hypothetical protein